MCKNEQTGEISLERKMMNDLTQGNVPKQLVTFAIPMLLGNLLQALYNTVDSIWVGRYLGKAALGAVSVSFPVMFTLVSAVMGVAMATSTMVAQFAGAKQYDMVRKTINNSLLLLGGGGIVVSIIGMVFNRPLLELINTPAELIPQASSYLLVFMSGIVFTFGYNVLSGILRGLGDSRTPLLFLFYATVANIILDPLMILGVGPFPRMGVAGAALATVISQALSTILAVRHLNRQNHLVQFDLRALKYDADLTRTTLRIGLPAGLQHTLISIGALAVNSVINTFGTDQVAAYGAAARLDQFAFMPAMSVGFATTAMVGQNIGANRPERVKEAVYWSNFLTAAITGVITLIALFAPRVLLSLFTEDAAVLANGSTYLRIVGFSYIPMALTFVVTGVLRGAGDTMATMVISLINLWVVRVPLARFLAGQFGINGVWLAIAASSVLGMVFTEIYYASGRWKNKAVVKHRMEPSPSES